MKKAELEKELLELKEKVRLLEARPQYCQGHYCGCNHYNYPSYPINPNYPWYTVTCGTGNLPTPNTTVTS